MVDFKKSVDDPLPLRKNRPDYKTIASNATIQTTGPAKDRGLKSHQPENPSDFGSLDQVSPNSRLQMTFGDNTNFSHHATARRRGLEDLTPG